MSINLKTMRRAIMALVAAKGSALAHATSCRECIERFEGEENRVRMAEIEAMWLAEVAEIDAAIKELQYAEG